MPADADLLCEYFISSSLNSKKFKPGPIELKNKLKTKSSSESNLFTAKNEFIDTIDFVKYDKNPMDYLKTKYQLLNNTNPNTKTVSLSLNNLNHQSQADQQPNANKAKSSSSLDLNWSKIKKIGIGLLNLGNNCYLNATLQCLAYTPPLSQWLITRPHSPICKFKQAKGFCALCEVERIIYDIFNSNGFAKPNSLCYNIKKISNVFGVGTQEDASEFFTTLLESMAKSIKFSLNGFNHIKPQTSQSKKINTILDDIFSFQFRSRITCSNCGRLSDTIENTNTWPVDVKYVQDIRKGMLHFLREEVLDGENAYKCEKCNKKTRATKKYSIRTAPNILVIHLKRFDFSYAGKLSHFVTYPEQLSLKSFMSNNEQTILSPESNMNEKSFNKTNFNYKLYGVLVHLGYTSHSGHYYSYVRAPNDVWYKADDQRISIVQSKDALSQNAYILFYSRVSTECTETPQTCVPITKQPNIPIKTPEPKKPEAPATNYLNSLNLPNQTNNNKIVIKFKPQLIKDSEEKKPEIYGPKLPSNLVLSTADPIDKSIENSKLSPVLKNKKSKNIKSMSKKKLKKQIKLLKEKLKDSKKQENNKDLLLKLRRKLKKYKKVLKEKKTETNGKKEEVVLNSLENNSTKRRLEHKEEEDSESNVSVSSLSSLSSTKSTDSSKNSKKFKKEPNGLALLKQYNSSPSPSPSPEPSPTHSISSSVSSMSSTSIKSNDSATKKELTSITYSYNPSSKLPTVNTDDSGTKKSASSSDVFAEMKQINIKTWSNNQSALNNKDSSEEKDDLDEYNQEFDKPYIKESKLKHNSKKYQSPYSGFHVYTHSNNTNTTWNKPNQINKFNNFRSNNFQNANHNRPKPFNVFHRR